MAVYEIIWFPNSTDTRLLEQNATINDFIAEYQQDGFRLAPIDQFDFDNRSICLFNGFLFVEYTAVFHEQKHKLDELIGLYTLMGGQQWAYYYAAGRDFSHMWRLYVDCIRLLGEI